MTKDDVAFSHESLETPESVVAYLEALANGLRTGRLLFCSGKQELMLKPKSLLKFSVKAANKGGVVRVLLSFAWREAPPKLSETKTLVIETPANDQAD